MISFFYGTNEQGIKEAVKQKTAAFLKNNSSGITRRFLLSEDGQLAQLAEILKTRSFFGEWQLLLAGESFSSTETVEKLVLILRDYLKTKPAEIEINIAEAKSGEELKKKHSALFALLTTEGQSKEFGELKGVKLERWAEERFQAAGLKIEPPALKKLLADAPELVRLANEIAKIIAYKKYRGPLAQDPKSQTVTAQNVADLVKSELAVNNFVLADAIASKNWPQAASLLNRYLAAGEDPFTLLGLLIYQFRALLKVKSLFKASIPYARWALLTGLHPFVIKKIYQQAGRFDLSELQKVYQSLWQLELRSKKGQTDPETGLFLFLSGLL